MADELGALTGFLYEQGLLKRYQRTGWQIVGVSDPESIAADQAGGLPEPVASLLQDTVSGQVLDPASRPPCLPYRRRPRTSSAGSVTAITRCISCCRLLDEVQLGEMPPVRSIRVGTCVPM